MGGEFDDICEAPQHAFVQVVQTIGCVDDWYGVFSSKRWLARRVPRLESRNILGFVAQDRSVWHGLQEGLGYAQLIAASGARLAFGVGFFPIIPGRVRLWNRGKHQRRGIGFLQIRFCRCRPDRITGYLPYCRFFLVPLLYRCAEKTYDIVPVIEVREVFQVQCGLALAS